MGSFLEAANPGGKAARVNEARNLKKMHYIALFGKFLRRLEAASNRRQTNPD